MIFYSHEKNLICNCADELENIKLNKVKKSHKICLTYNQSIIMVTEAVKWGLLINVCSLSCARIIPEIYFYGYVLGVNNIAYIIF